MRRLLPLLLLAAACDFGFKPETLVDDLRVLSAVSSPPELTPGQSAAIKALVVDPKFPQPTTIWLGCDPDPFNQNRSACADPAVVNDPSKLGQLDALPAGVKFLGLGDTAAIQTERPRISAQARLRIFLPRLFST